MKNTSGSYTLVKVSTPVFWQTIVSKFISGCNSCSVSFSLLKHEHSSKLRSAILWRTMVHFWSSFSSLETPMKVHHCSTCSIVVNCSDRGSKVQSLTNGYVTLPRLIDVIFERFRPTSEWFHSTKLLILGWAVIIPVCCHRNWACLK